MAAIDEKYNVPFGVGISKQSLQFYTSFVIFQYGSKSSSSRWLALCE